MGELYRLWIISQLKQKLRVLNEAQGRNHQTPQQRMWQGDSSTKGRNSVASHKQDCQIHTVQVWKPEGGWRGRGKKKAYPGIDCSFHGEGNTAWKRPRLCRQTHTQCLGPMRRRHAGSCDQSIWGHRLDVDICQYTTSESRLSWSLCVRKFTLRSFY